MDRLSIESRERFLAGRFNLDEIGPGAQMILFVALIFGSVVLMMVLVWLFLRPYRQRRRKLVKRVPKTKTTYTAQYKYRDEQRICKLSLVFRHEQESGWKVTGTSMGDKCKFVRGRISTFGTVEIELGEGGMVITGVFDPERGAISGTWKTKRSAKQSFDIVLEPESQARSPVPTHASIV